MQIEIGGVGAEDHDEYTWVAATAFASPLTEERAEANRAVVELEATTAALNGMGVFAKLDRIKGIDEQVFLDLVGDSAHAVRGIDLATGAGTIRY